VREHLHLITNYFFGHFHFFFFLENVCSTEIHHFVLIQKVAQDLSTFFSFIWTGCLVWYSAQVQGGLFVDVHPSKERKNSLSSPLFFSFWSFLVLSPFFYCLGPPQFCSVVSFNLHKCWRRRRRRRKRRKIKIKRVLNQLSNQLSLESDAFS